MTQMHYILKDENGKIVKMTDSFPLAQKGGYEQTKTTQKIVRCDGKLFLESECPAIDLFERAEILRSQRNELLAQSDWTQLPDAPLSADKKADWTTYRQALRSIPEQVDFPKNAVFPSEPE